MWGRLHVKTTQIPPFFCCIPVFQSFLSIYYFILCKFFTLAKKIRRSAGHRCIFICILFFFFFRVLPILAPLKKISWKESKFQTMKRRNASDDGERGNKKLREQAVCELSSSQESSSTQSVKEILRRRTEQKRVKQNVQILNSSSRKLTPSHTTYDAFIN